MNYSDIVDISDIVGKKIIMAFHSVLINSGSVVFVTDDGIYVMTHDQECCETVRLVPECGGFDLSDLNGGTVLSAAERTSSEEPTPHSESHTWTFYTISTIDADVSLRWLGESNGYYSERVDIYRVDSLEAIHS